MRTNKTLKLDGTDNDVFNGFNIQYDYSFDAGKIVRLQATASKSPISNAPMGHVQVSYVNENVLPQIQYNNMLPDQELTDFILAEIEVLREALNRFASFKLEALVTPEEPTEN